MGLKVGVSDGCGAIRAHNASIRRNFTEGVLLATNTTPNRLLIKPVFKVCSEYLVFGIF